MVRRDALFQRCWITLKGNKLQFFLDEENMLNPFHIIPLIKVISVSPSTDSEEFLQSIWTYSDCYSNCGFQIDTAEDSVSLLARNRKEQERWVKTLLHWKPFFTDDGRNYEYKPLSNNDVEVFFQDFLNFFLQE